MKKTGAQIIIETLIEQGVDTVFGYPGGQVLTLYDQLYQNAHRLRHIMTCHEQGAAHAADGYARATGKTGVVIATSGPGATNLVTGIATAYLDSTPLVAITGNVALPLIGRDSFQEVDIQGITMPVTKHNYIVKDVTKLAGIIREAFVIAGSGRPGPVLIDVPKDIQQAVCEYEPAPAVQKDAYDHPDGRALDEALALLNKSQRPFIYAGGGVVISDAAQQLDTFSKLLDAPVASSIMGLSAMPGSCPRFLGMTGMHGGFVANSAMHEADLVIAVGSRFSDRATGDKSKFAANAKILHLDVDPAEIDKNIQSYLSLVGNIKDVLESLNGQLKQTKRDAWWAQIGQMKDPALPEPEDRLTPRMLIEKVRQYAGEDVVVATDVGQHQMWTAQYYKFSKPRTFLTSGGLGTMGFGMGAAIGGSIATGKRAVLFTGDGSFHMNLNELATAVSNRLNLVVVIFNNGVLGMVRQWQSMFFDKRYASTTLERQTDFKALAEAFGARGYTISAPEEMDGVLESAFSSQGVSVIDCRIGMDEQVLPMIPPGGSISNIICK